MTNQSTLTLERPLTSPSPLNIDVVVVDATNLLHRCHHAMASTNLRNADGAPIWAVSGLVNYLAKFLTMYQPRKMVVAFDLDGCPFRKELAPQYKAGRSAPDPDVVSQLILAPEVIAATGIACSAISGWEADDICATVAVKARGPVAVISSDKDAHQLICDRVIVVKPEGTVFDDVALHAKFGVIGSRWIEFAALVGEDSDNLNGVNGIGKTRAAALIAAFADVEDAYADLEALTAAVGKTSAIALERDIEVFRRNRKVATLRSDLSLGVTGLLPGSTGVRDTLSGFGLDNAGARLTKALAAF